MKYTKQFIEKAIEGGWKCPFSISHYDISNISMMLLDPKSWEAVWNTNKGKCWACNGKGYRFDMFDKTKKVDCGNCKTIGTDEYEKPWGRQMLGLTQALIDGRSIEDYLKELLK